MGDYFPENYLGFAETIFEECIADYEMVIFQGCKKSTASLILRGANEYMLDELERSMHDALCVVKRVKDACHVVPGGGAVEAAVFIHLEHKSLKMDPRKHLALCGYAEALSVIPKTLAINA